MKQSQLRQMIKEEIKLFEGNIKNVVNKFEKNPYGIGADVIDTTEATVYAVFRFSDSFSREDTIKELKKLGIPVKKMKKGMSSKGFKYRYSLYVYY